MYQTSMVYPTTGLIPNIICAVLAQKIGINFTKSVKQNNYHNYDIFQINYLTHKSTWGR